MFAKLEGKCAPNALRMLRQGELRQVTSLRLVNLTESRIRAIVQLVLREEVASGTADLLRRRGVQVTAQRLAVLRAVSGRPHGTADEIEELARAEIGAVSRQAVYDALGILADNGLIRRIQPARSPARYEDRVGDNHHHLVCRTCGLTVDVDCAVGHRPCLQAAEDHGFIIDEAEVVYWGSCPACQQAGRRWRGKRAAGLTT